MSRRRLWAAAVVAAALIAAATLAVHRYRGATLGLWRLVSRATPGEVENLLPNLAYWLEFVEKLEFEPVTGTWEFPATAAADANGFDAGKLAFHRGDFARAVEQIRGDIERRGESEDKLFWLAMSELRLGEVRNCLEMLRGRPADHEGPPMCTLPLLRPHQQAAAARAAAKSFQRILDDHDPEDRLVRWLLNFSAMAAGDFPDGVPERYRVDTPFIDRFYGAGLREAQKRFGGLRFVDRAPALGVDTFDAGRGVAVEDFDGDGWLDIIAGGGFDEVRFYRNLEGAGFADLTAESGLGGLRQPFFITASDYDGDGDMDLFVSRLFDRFLLFRNLGGGRFVDATASAGLRAVVGPNRKAATWVSAWGDVDNDGDLDLFLAQWAVQFPLGVGLVTGERMDSALMINDGGVYRDRTAEFGLARFVRDLLFVGATFGDVDEDGWQDLFLSSPLWGTSAMFRNVGGRRFEPVAGIDTAPPGFTAAFVDVDHDGRLDLFQGGMADARTSTEMTVFGEHLDRYRSGWSTIFLQAADGTFARRTDLFGGGDGSGGAMPMGTMGASYGDLDNDGCLDFYLGTGDPEAWFVLPSLMYLGERDGVRCTGWMTNVSMLEGFGTVQKGHGIVFFDFDRDGDEDVYSVLGGMWPADRWPNQLLVNESPVVGSWVEVRLRGRRSNRHGVGSRLRVVATATDGEEIVRYAQMSNGTGFGSSPYLAHVGLLDAVAIREIGVVWAGSGCRATYAAKIGELNVLDEADCLGRQAGATARGAVTPSAS